MCCFEDLYTRKKTRNFYHEYKEDEQLNSSEQTKNVSRGENNKSAKYKMHRL